MKAKPEASLSIDLDNKWAYLRAAGRDHWESSSNYFPIAVDRIVEILGSHELPLTVFLVGRDLLDEAEIATIQQFNSLPRWEAANHSLNHLPWMHTMSEGEIDEEIAVTHDRIVAATGQTPVGFRGPGFSCPEEVLRVLERRGYLYDASVFPTSVAPIARAIFLARTQLKGPQREKAKSLYGGFASMRNPNTPYRRCVPMSASGSKRANTEATQAIWEIPVTVMPFLRTPIHFSYLNFLASINVPLAKTYFQTSLRICRTWGVAPSLLLHPPDFLGFEDDPEMAYLPGMKMPRGRKLQFMNWALSLYAREFEVKTMIEQLRELDPNLSPKAAARPDSESTRPQMLPASTITTLVG